MKKSGQLQVNLASSIIKELLKPLILINAAAESEYFKLLKLKAHEGEFVIQSGSESGMIEVTITDCKCNGDWEAIVVGKVFLDIVKNSTGTLELIYAESSLVVKFGRARYTIPIQENADFDDAMNISFQASAYNSFDLERLKYKIGCISQSLAKDDMVASLKNIYIYGEYLVASDGVFGSITKYPSVSKLDKNSFNPFFTNIITSLQTDNIGICFDEERVYATAYKSGVYTMCFIISSDAGVYPITRISPIIKAYESVRKTGKIAAIFSPVNTAAAISRLQIFCTDDSPAIQISIDVKAGIVKMMSGTDVYVGNEEIPVEIEHGDDYSVVIDGKALAKALKVLNGDCCLCGKSEKDIQYVSDAETMIFFYGLS